MTAEVFEGVKKNPNDGFEIQNTLSIETRPEIVNDRMVALVNVDTNHKSTRPGSHPVNLTVVDALNAAVALVAAAQRAYESSHGLDSVAVLRALAHLDSESLEMRDLVLCDVATKPAPDPEED